MVFNCFREEYTNKGVWANAEYKWIYHLSATQKGALAEKAFQKLHHPHVLPRENSEHDRVMKGDKFEIKLACQSVDGKTLKWGHVKLDYDYDYLCLFGVFPSKIKMWHLPKNILFELNDDCLKDYYTKRKKENLTVGKYLQIPSQVPSWLYNYEKEICDI